MPGAYNRAVFSFEMAKQASKGAIAADPQFKFQATGGNISPNRTDGNQLTGDSTVFSRGYTYVDRIEAGGSPVLVASPLGVGALIHTIMGTSYSPSGGADPYTHAMTPNNTSGSTGWYTFFKRLDALYEKYGDCKVTALQIRASVDQKIMQLTPTIISTAKTQKVAAWTPATAETIAFDWWDARGTWLVNGGASGQFVTAALPYDLQSLKDWLLAFKTAYNAHLGAHTTLPHGLANDAANVMGYTTPVPDLAGCIAALTEVKTDFNVHRASAVFHQFADSTHTMDYGTPCADLPACLVAAAEAHDEYNRHVGMAVTIRDFTITISRGYETYYGQEVTPVDAVEGRGSVDLNATLLFDTDQRLLYDWVMYGSPNAATGAGVTEAIVEGNFYSKFSTLESAKERSVAFLMPSVQWEATGIGDAVAGDPAGGPLMLTLTGHAVGTAPIFTATVVNSRSTSY